METTSKESFCFTPYDDETELSSNQPVRVFNVNSINSKKEFRERGVRELERFVSKQEKSKETGLEKKLSIKDVNDEKTSTFPSNNKFRTVEPDRRRRVALKKYVPRITVSTSNGNTIQRSSGKVFSNDEKKEGEDQDGSVCLFQNVRPAYKPLDTTTTTTENEDPQGPQVSSDNTRSVVPKTILKRKVDQGFDLIQMNSITSNISTNPYAYKRIQDNDVTTQNLNPRWPDREERFKLGFRTMEEDRRFCIMLAKQWEMAEETFGSARWSEDEAKARGYIDSVMGRKKKRVRFVIKE